jgi:hypothetical protein
VGGVPAIHIQRGIRLGITQFLSLPERVLEGEACIGHAAEDVVRGAVDDSGKRMDAVADEGVLDGAYDRNATGDGGFEMDRCVHFAGKSEEFHAALGEQGLVPCDDGFFRAQGRGDDFVGIRRAADELDDDVHRRILHQGTPIGGEKFGRGAAIGRAGLREVAHQDLGNVHRHSATGAVGNEGAVTFQGVPNAGTDGPESSQTNAE